MAGYKVGSQRPSVYYQKLSTHIYERRRSETSRKNNLPDRRGLSGKVVVAADRDLLCPVLVQSDFANRLPLPNRPERELSMLAPSCTLQLARQLTLPPTAPVGRGSSNQKSAGLPPSRTKKPSCHHFPSA